MISMLTHLSFVSPFEDDELDVAIKAVEAMKINVSSERYVSSLI